MVRTVISLEPEDKAWLDRKAKEEKVPMTRLVERAIRRLRTETETSPKLEALLRETSGLWKAGDGLAYQRQIRRQWQRKP